MTVSKAYIQEKERGETAPSAPVAPAGAATLALLHDLEVKPLSTLVARKLVEREHYLRSFPGGTKLAFGVFLHSHLLGAVTLGVGPTNAHRLVDRATNDDCLTLTRLWLSDILPRNSESHTLAIITVALRRNSSIKFLVSYADPSQGHIGIVYQASGWLYTGLSATTPLYDIGDGINHHSRSLGYIYGSRSVKYLTASGLDVKLIPQASKHRYVKFVDNSWRPRLKVPVLPYPKKEDVNGSI